MKIRFHYRHASPVDNTICDPNDHFLQRASEAMRESKKTYHKLEFYHETSGPEPIPPKPTIIQRLKKFLNIH